MRDYLDGILSLIGAESLTDEEFSSNPVTDINDHLGVYNYLLGILQARELVSDMSFRLKSYFDARGISLASPNVGRSNIFVGAEL
jgi:hypothetical protein